MKAAFLYKGRDMRVEETGIPAPAAHEALIRVKMAGICGSDLHRYLGDRPVRYYPMILGHEFFGIVEKTGADVSRFKAGDRVVGNPYFTCNRCEYCLKGLGNLCRSRTNIGIDMPGCFAEYLVMPEYALWAVHPDVPDQEAAMTEPTAVALRAIHMSQNILGKSVAIIGAGTMGQLIGQLAAKSGADVTVVDVVDRKLDVCKRMGVAHAVNSTRTDPIAQVKALTDGEGAHVVIETAGIPKTVEQSVKMARPGGRVVLIGLSTAPASISPIDIARNEIQLMGSVMYIEEFGQAVGLINKRALTFEPMISHILPLDQCGAGFELVAAGREAMKVLIRME
jgi:2-desacetyl-2-hydroxyethyl bacteriochlorophyllide A dehydrogenase